MILFLDRRAIIKTRVIDYKIINQTAAKCHLSYLHLAPVVLINITFIVLAYAQV